MLVLAISTFVTVACLYPCEAIPLGNLTGSTLPGGFSAFTTFAFALAFLWSWGTVLSTMCPSYLISVLSNTLTCEKILDRTEEELIRVRFGAALSTIIRVQIILQLVATSDLPKQNIPECQFFWDMGNTRDDRLPIVNERTQVIVDQADLEKVFYGVDGPNLFVGLKVLLKHVQHLTSPYSPCMSSFGFFVVYDLAC